MKTPKNILQMLQRFNPNLPTKNWRILKDMSKGPTSQAILILNMASVASIEADKGDVSFCYSAIQVRINKSDTADISSPADNPIDLEVDRSLVMGGTDSSIERTRRLNEGTWRPSIMVKRSTQLWGWTLWIYLSSC